jgi:hypothetical protein
MLRRLDSRRTRRVAIIVNIVKQRAAEPMMARGGLVARSRDR